jgi:hypothetical protein
MRTLQILFAAALLAFATAAAAAPPDPAIAGWDRGQAYDKLYDPNLEVVVPGVVKQVENFTPMPGMAEGVRVRVESRGGMLWVHLAPAAWLVAQDFELKPGDEVVVTGSYVRMGQDRVVLANTLERDGRQLRLRDDSGKPAWVNWHPRPA